jgi:hypothetical protein
MTYELWSRVSRSIVGAFDTENAALAAVREALDAHGRPYAEQLALIREDSRGRSKAVADGRVLVERALAAEPYQVRAST